MLYGSESGSEINHSGSIPNTANKYGNNHCFGPYPAQNLSPVPDPSFSSKHCLELFKKIKYAKPSLISFNWLMRLVNHFNVFKNKIIVVIYLTF